MSDLASKIFEDVRVKKLIGNSGVPTATLGSSLTGTVAVAGNDIAGTVTVTITAAATFAAQSPYFQLNFNTAYATAPTVLFWPANVSAALLSGLYTKSPGTTSVQLAAANAGTTPASATYVWNYHVIQ